MIRLFDIVRPKREYVEKELTERALSIISVDQGVLVHAEFADEEEMKQWLLATGVVTETNGDECHIEWFDKGTHLHNAWWHGKDLDVINNIMCIIGDAMAHPFGSNTHQGSKIFEVK